MHRLQNQCSNRRLKTLPNTARYLRSHKRLSVQELLYLPYQSHTDGNRPQRHIQSHIVIHAVLLKLQKPLQSYQEPDPSTQSARVPMLRPQLSHSSPDFQHFLAKDWIADKPDLRFPLQDRSDGTFTTDRTTLLFLQCSEKSGLSCAPQRKPVSERRHSGQSAFSLRRRQRLVSVLRNTPILATCRPAKCCEIPELTKSRPDVVYPTFDLSVLAS